MKRKTMAKRERNGKPQRAGAQQQVITGAEMQRLRAAAVAGMRDAMWGTTLGWLYLSGKMSAPQFAAGRRWSELAADYSAAMSSPSPPRTAGLERSGREATDPGSEQGQQQAHRDERTAVAYTTAAALLRLDARRMRAVVNVCEKNLMPVDAVELEHLVAGLHTLAIGWSARGVRRK